jgi:hypothetical protein
MSSHAPIPWKRGWKVHEKHLPVTSMIRRKRLWDLMGPAQ